MIEIDTTLLSILFALFGAFYSLLLIAVLRVRRRRKVPEGVSTASTFSLMIPARNEEAVLSRTLEGILAMDYPVDKFEVLVIDDGSADRTSEIADRVRGRNSGRGSALHIPEPRAGCGESEALQLAFP